MPPKETPIPFLSPSFTCRNLSLTEYHHLVRQNKCSLIPNLNCNSPNPFYPLSPSSTTIATVDSRSSDDCVGSCSMLIEDAKTAPNPNYSPIFNLQYSVAHMEHVDGHRNVSSPYPYVAFGTMLSTRNNLKDHEVGSI